jgi:hypothetical protein
MVREMTRMWHYRYIEDRESEVLEGGWRLQPEMDVGHNMLGMLVEGQN